MKIFLATFALLCPSSAFGAQNLTGHWAIHNNIAGNENDVQCELVVTDNKITGSCKSQDKHLPVTGAVDGNQVTWPSQSETNGSPITLIYTATLDDSNKIVGTVEVQPYGVTGDITATRSSASSQSGHAAAEQSGSASSQSGHAAAGQSGSEDAAAEQLLVVQAAARGPVMTEAAVGKPNPPGPTPYRAQNHAYTLPIHALSL